jgi:hypothetical protein
MRCKIAIEISENGQPTSTVVIDTESGGAAEITGKLWPADWKFVNGVITLLNEASQRYHKSRPPATTAQ